MALEIPAGVVKVMKGCFAVYVEVQKRIAQIQLDDKVLLGWAGQQPFAILKFKLRALESSPELLHNPDALEAMVKQLKADMDATLKKLKRFADLDKHTFNILHEMLYKTRQQAIAELEAHVAALDGSVQATIEVVSQLVLPMEIMRYNKLKLAHQVAQVMNALETEHNSVIEPIMSDLALWKALLGDHFAVIMLHDHEMAKVANDYRLKLTDFWRKPQTLIKQKALAKGELFTTNLLGRAKASRVLGEPLDIANWYAKDKHTGTYGKHYVDGLLVCEYTYTAGLQRMVDRVGFALEELVRVAGLEKYKDATTRETPEELKSLVHEANTVLAAVRQAGRDVGTALGALRVALAALNDASSRSTVGMTKRELQEHKKNKKRQEIALKSALLDKTNALKGLLTEAQAHADSTVKAVSKPALAVYVPAAADWAGGVSADDDDAALDKAVQDARSAPQGAQQAARLASASRAKAAAQDRRAAAGVDELARWAGQRAAELKASAAAGVQLVDEVVGAADAVQYAAGTEDVAERVEAATTELEALAGALGSKLKLEAVQDNAGRPGRYKLIQEQELTVARQWGQPPSSLTLARALKALGTGGRGIPFKGVWPAGMKGLLESKGRYQPSADEGLPADSSLYQRIEAWAAQEANKGVEVPALFQAAQTAAQREREAAQKAAATARELLKKSEVSQGAENGNDAAKKAGTDQQQELS